MHKIDGAGHVAGEFSRGDPNATPIVKPTVVTADWLNATMEELASVIEGAGLALDKADNSQLLQALRLLTPSTLGLRNLFVNGDFALWQRGVSAGAFSTSAQYRADRWRCRPTSGASAIVNRGTHAAPYNPLDFDLGSPLGEVWPRHFLNWNQTVSTPSGEPTVGQRIEDVRALAGETVTVSVDVLANNGITTGFDLDAVQNFGAGGPSNVTTSAGFIGAATNNAWVRIKGSVTLPNVNGTTIGEGSWTELRLRMPEDTNFDVRISLAQAEIGGTMTPFELRPPSLDLLLALRYFEKSYPLDVTPGTTAQQEEAAHAYHDFGMNGPLDFEGLERRFLVSKAVDPTVTFYNPDNGSAGQFYFDGSRTISSVSGTSRESTGYPVVASLTGSGEHYARAHYAADAEL